MGGMEKGVSLDTGLGWRMGGGRKIGHNQSSRLVAILSSRAIFLCYFIFFVSRFCFPFVHGAVYMCESVCYFAVKEYLDSVQVD